MHEKLVHWLLPAPLMMTHALLRHSVWLAGCEELMELDLEELFEELKEEDGFDELIKLELEEDLDELLLLELLDFELEELFEELDEDCVHWALSVQRLVPGPMIIVQALFRHSVWLAGCEELMELDLEELFEELKEEDFELELKRLDEDDMHWELLLHWLVPAPSIMTHAFPRHSV